MPITQQDYFLKPGETPEQYSARIAGLRAKDTGTTQPPPTTNQTAQVNQALGGNYFDTASGAAIKPFLPTSIPSPVPAPNPATTGIPAPSLPTPNAPSAYETYAAGATADAAAKRKALEDSYKAQIDAINAKAAEAQKKVDDLTVLQKEGSLDPMKDLSAPFRQTLEDTQREKLYINQNFEENQKLTNELDALLTEGNTLIAQQKGLPIASNFLAARTAKTMTDVAARAGVIQAVMAARNSQIGVAENMIDRSVAAINADRQDQLNYYQTLYNYYEGQKDEQGKKLLSLDADKKEFLKAQIGLLENDMQRAQSNADYIKNAMQDPDTALAYASSGVTLNDTPEQINQKLAKYAYQKELMDTSNTMATNGYTALMPGQSAPAGSVVTRITDSLGNTKSYWKPAPTGNSNVMTDNERALFSQFRNEPIVKDYNTILAKKLSVDQIIKAGVGGPGDLALVYEFMKGLDPNSVVRESEYASAAKSGNIFAGALSTFNGYFKDTGGFMPASTAQAFKAIVDSKFNVQTSLYNNTVDQYKSLAERQGLNPENVVIDYAGAVPNEPPSTEVPNNEQLQQEYQAYQSDNGAGWVDLLLKGFSIGGFSPF